MGYLDAHKILYSRELPDDYRRVEPCSNSEIDALETELSIRLPLSYREFLLWMGNGPWGIWSPDYWLCSAQPKSNRLARELVIECNSPLAVPDNAFVFLHDESISFYFFLLNGDNDPAVYYFLIPEIENYVKQGFTLATLGPNDPYTLYARRDHAGADFFQKAEHFSDFLMSEIEMYGQLKREREARHAKRSGNPGQ